MSCASQAAAACCLLPPFLGGFFSFFPFLLAFEEPLDDCRLLLDPDPFPDVRESLDSREVFDPFEEVRPPLPELLPLVRLCPDPVRESPGFGRLVLLLPRSGVAGAAEDFSLAALSRYSQYSL